MEDRYFLKINKYALDYLKNILPEYNVECDKCGAGKYDIGKTYHILSNKYEEAFMHEEVASDNEITPLEILEEVLSNMHGFIFEFKEASDEDWMEFIYHQIPEEIIRENADGGDVYMTDNGDIIFKLFKNIYFFVDDNCSCLKIMGYKESLDNK